KKSGKFSSKLMKEESSATHPAFHLLSRLEEAHAHLQGEVERLREKWVDSHQAMEQIVAYMSEGLMFVTLQGVVTLFNPAAEKLTGLKQEEVLGSSYWTHFSDALFGFSLEEALKKGGVERQSIVTLFAQQKKSDVEITATPIPQKGILLLLR